MNIIIAGASGFIGTHLLNSFLENGHSVIGLSRNPDKQPAQVNLIWKKWQNDNASDWQGELETTDVVINLIGESLAEKRWTKKRKEKIINSRTDSCSLFVKALKQVRHKPSLFFQASAIGYYADGDNITESDPSGDSFLSEVTKKWEEASAEIEDLGIKRILLRTGIILANESLIIKKFKVPFLFFAGGHLGNGQQMMSWIHIDDVVSSIQFILNHAQKSQIFNLTAPNPVTMKEFCKKFGKKMNRPSWFHVPAFLLILLFGQVAKETMLKGQKILPQNLIKSGYKFRYPDVSSAINSLKSI